MKKKLTNLDIAVLVVFIALLALTPVVWFIGKQVSKVLDDIEQEGRTEHTPSHEQYEQAMVVAEQEVRDRITVVMGANWLTDYTDPMPTRMGKRICTVLRGAVTTAECEALAGGGLSELILAQKARRICDGGYFGSDIRECLKYADMPRGCRPHRIGENIDLVIYLCGRHYSHNVSDYGDGERRHQYCWHGYDNMFCLYTGDDGVITSYN